MKTRPIITAVLLLFVAASVVYLILNELQGKRSALEKTGELVDRGGQDGGEDADRPHSNNRDGHKVIAYYFHGAKRCRTCRAIERYTDEAIVEGFVEELETGKLEWHIVNVDKPEDEHFVHDYELTTKSVVLVELNNGEQTRWKNLDMIWKLVGDKQAFVDYIKEETEQLLGE